MNPCFPFTFTLPLVAAALALCVGAYSLYKTLKRRCNQSVMLPVHMEKILPSVSGSIKSPESVLTFNLEEWETRRQARDKSPESVLTFNLQEWETSTRTDVCFTDENASTLGDSLHFLSNNRII